MIQTSQVGSVSGWTIINQAVDLSQTPNAVLNQVGSGGTGNPNPGGGSSLSVADVDLRINNLTPSLIKANNTKSLKQNHPVWLIKDFANLAGSTTLQSPPPVEGDTWISLNTGNASNGMSIKTWHIYTYQDGNWQEIPRRER